MRFEHPELNTSFEIAEPVSYRVGLRYASEVEVNIDRAGLYERLWRGVQAVAQDWQSPHVALDADLSAPLTGAGLAAIKWACLSAFGYMEGLKEIPLP